MRFITSCILFLGLSTYQMFFNEVIVQVKGVVCSFCASTIEKSFKKQGFTGLVKVDLDNSTVLLKKTETIKMTDDSIRKIILDSGYNIKSINRQ